VDPGAASLISELRNITAVIVVDIDAAALLIGTSYLLLADAAVSTGR
jgi:hypothetical protein